MNKLLADFTVLYTKLHTLHYNVVGEQFFQIHVMLEKEYDKVHDHIDAVAESGKMNGEEVVATLAQMLEMSTIKEAESRDYQGSEVLEILLADYETLNTQIEALKDGATFYQANLLEDIQTDLIKTIWFLKSTLK